MTSESVKEVRAKINNALDELDNHTEIDFNSHLETQLLWLTCDAIKVINILLDISGSPWKLKKMIPEAVSDRVSLDLLNETTGLSVEMVLRASVKLRHVLPMLITMR